MIRAWGAEMVDGQTLTMRPALSKESEPQRAGESPFEAETRALPSGPGRW